MILDEDNYIRITGQEDSLELRLLTFEPFNIFLNSNIPITTPKIFTDNKQSGEFEQRSSLMVEGKIHYTEFPNIQSISFKESDIVKFGTGGSFKIERIRFNPDTGIEIRVRGVPTKLSINDNDRRLTLYRILQESEFGGIAIDYVVWAIPLIIGIMGLMLIDRVKVISDSPERNVPRFRNRRRNKSPKRIGLDRGRKG